jgi:hypothetical protein
MARVGRHSQCRGRKTSAKKTFKDYEPGFVHADIKYLPQMPDETSRRYLFAAIDRARRRVCLHIYSDMAGRRSVNFLRLLKLASEGTAAKEAGAIC